jgi:hypothetical protein
VKFADGYEVKITEKVKEILKNSCILLTLEDIKRFFEEFHEQHLMVGNSMGEVKKAKATEFYKTMGFEGAESHIDDKHGVDIDDIFNVNDILPQKMKEKYSISLINLMLKIRKIVGLGYLKLIKSKNICSF